MTALRYGSVCSGIEAASVAWHPLGWRASFLSEIEPFPRAVLKHHFPETPLHGDFTSIQAGEYEPIDLLVGGTPCQSFSVAGLRGGLDDDRGNLALEYLRLADRLRPRWLVWENVPGVLSSAGGRDFGAILGGMVELGYGFAYRVLDAQFFGVAQRRRRVFVVGHLGDWRRAAAVLFERHSLSGHPAPRRDEGEGLTPFLAHGAVGSNGAGIGAPGDPALTIDAGGAMAIQAGALRTNPASGQDGIGVQADVAYTLEARAEVQAVSFNWQAAGKQTTLGQSVEQANTLGANTTQAIAFALRGRSGGAMPEVGDGNVGALRAASGGSSRDYVAIPINTNALRGDTHAKTPSKDAAGVSRLRDPGLGVGAAGDPADTLQAAGPGAVGYASVVRRLTPRECERLQGFPDDYTLIPWRNGMAPDGPRYKALGNSMAVPVMAWIGRRIAAVDSLSAQSSRDAA
jgi:DNA (cytosine-5)-methyltransferase 1